MNQMRVDLPNLVRWRSTLPVAVAVLALVPSTVLLAAMQGPDDPLKADVAGPSRPPRALLRIGTDDLRMNDRITALAFSADGRHLAAASADQGPLVEIFDVRTGRLVNQLVAPGNARGWVESVAYSPDGTKLLWGESDGEVGLWDLSRDRVLFRENVHEGVVVDVAFSPDGSLMASAGGDFVGLRRLPGPRRSCATLTKRPGIAPGQLVAPKAIEPPAPRRPRIGCVAFTPDGTRLVAGTSSDITLLVWRIGDGRLLRTNRRRAWHAGVRLGDTLAELRGSHSRRAPDHVRRENREAGRAIATQR